MNNNPPSVDHAALHNVVAAALTDVCKAFQSGEQPDVDVADFLEGAICAAVANMGDVDLLRSYSSYPRHEALRMILDCNFGPAGMDGGPTGLGDLGPLRTAPIVVPLHVAAIVEDQWEKATVEQQKHLLKPFDTAVEELDTPNDDPEENDRIADAQIALEQQYQTAYAEYAEAFTAQVNAAAQQIHGLDVPVSVTANTSAERLGGIDVTNPRDDDDSVEDRFVTHCWNHAHTNTPTLTAGSVTT